MRTWDEVNKQVTKKSKFRRLVYPDVQRRSLNSCKHFEVELRNLT